MNKIITGDALTMLRDLPDSFVQTCVTSPPYYGLRDYGIEGQIGLEDTPQAYIARLVEVFREVRRVMRDDGTLWLNIGDSYAGSGKGGQSEEKRSENWQPTYTHKGLVSPGYKPKDLMMIPARVALALQADGWYLRSSIIWHKPNCMPESVTDRPTSAHEHVFLLAKSPHYFYDGDAIREPHTLIERIGNRQPNFAPHQWIPNGNNFGNHNRAGGDGVGYNPSGRNKRNVWTIASQPYSEAHFATMPPKLVEPCILAGTSPRACEHCGSPWERVTERDASGQGNASLILRQVEGHGHDRVARGEITRAGEAHVTTIGWQPTCTCTQEGSGKCIVLDPFMGAGTVALVAIQHKRDYLGIELNPSYCELINKRIHTVQQGLWAEVAI